MMIEGKRQFFHHVVYFAFNPGVVLVEDESVDHINRDTRNNRLDNLRIVDKATQSRNRGTVK